MLSEIVLPNEARFFVWRTLRRLIVIMRFGFGHGKHNLMAKVRSSDR